MDELSGAERVEHQRFAVALRFTPAKRIDPEEADRIAQQTAQRTGRLGALKDGTNGRMVLSNKPIVGCDCRASPVVPAALCADCLKLDHELLRSGHETVGFAKSVLGHGVAAEVGVLAVCGEQRATSEEASVTVASGS